MGATKTTYYSDRLNEMAVIAKSLGHPARITIIRYLLESHDCNCKEIVNILPLTQPTVSQHLRELKNAGLINGIIEKNEIYYSVNLGRISMLKRFLDTLN